MTLGQTEKGCYSCAWKEDSRLLGQEEPAVQGQELHELKCGVPVMLCTEPRSSTAIQSAGKREETWDHRKPPRAPWTGWGLGSAVLSIRG